VLVVAFLFSLIKMPQVSAPDESSATMKGIFRHRHLLFGVIAQFFYVGAQTSLWAYFVDLKLNYAHDDNLSFVTSIYGITSNMSAIQAASYHASFAFILFMLGRFFGTWLLSKFKAEQLLSIYALTCLLLLGYAYFVTGLTAILAISMTYFFMSIMFPTIFALSIKNLGSQVKLGSSLVIMAIVGGAVLPPITGYLSQTGMQNALILPWISFLFILYFGLKGHRVNPALSSQTTHS
jgi:FHS family L-fucose permease-like MFS transporter